MSSVSVIRSLLPVGALEAGSPPVSREGTRWELATEAQQRCLEELVESGAIDPHTLELTERLKKAEIPLPTERIKTILLEKLRATIEHRLSNGATIRYSIYGFLEYVRRRSFGSSREKIQDIQLTGSYVWKLLLSDEEYAEKIKKFLGLSSLPELTARDGDLHLIFPAYIVNDTLDDLKKIFLEYLCGANQKEQSSLLLDECFSKVKTVTAMGAGETNKFVLLAPKGSFFEIMGVSALQMSHLFRQNNTFLSLKAWFFSLLQKPEEVIRVRGENNYALQGCIDSLLGIVFCDEPEKANEEVWFRAMHKLSKGEGTLLQPDQLTSFLAVAVRQLDFPARLSQRIQSEGTAYLLEATLFFAHYPGSLTPQIEEQLFVCWRICDFATALPLSPRILRQIPLLLSSASHVANCAGLFLLQHRTTTSLDNPLSPALLQIFLACRKEKRPPFPLLLASLELRSTPCNEEELRLLLEYFANFPKVMDWLAKKGALSRRPHEGSGRLLVLYAFLKESPESPLLSPLQELLQDALAVGLPAGDPGVAQLPEVTAWMIETLCKRQERSRLITLFEKAKEGIPLSPPLAGKIWELLSKGKKGKALPVPMMLSLAPLLPEQEFVTQALQMLDVLLRGGDIVSARRLCYLETKDKELRDQYIALLSKAANLALARKQGEAFVDFFEKLYKIFDQADGETPLFSLIDPSEETAILLPCKDLAFANSSGSAKKSAHAFQQFVEMAAKCANKHELLNALVNADFFGNFISNTQNDPSIPKEHRVAFLQGWSCLTRELLTHAGSEEISHLGALLGVLLEPIAVSLHEAFSEDVRGPYRDFMESELHRCCVALLSDLERGEDLREVDAAYHKEQFSSISDAIERLMAHGEDSWNESIKSKYLIPTLAKALSTGNRHIIDVVRFLVKQSKSDKLDLVSLIDYICKTERYSLVPYVFEIIIPCLKKNSARPEQIAAIGSLLPSLGEIPFSPELMDQAAEVFTYPSVQEACINKNRKKIVYLLAHFIRHFVNNLTPKPSTKEQAVFLFMQQHTRVWKNPAIYAPASDYGPLGLLYTFLIRMDTSGVEFRNEMLRLKSASPPCHAYLITFVMAASSSPNDLIAKYVSLNLLFLLHETEVLPQLAVNSTNYAQILRILGTNAKVYACFGKEHTSYFTKVLACASREALSLFIEELEQDKSALSHPLLIASAQAVRRATFRRYCEIIREVQRGALERQQAEGGELAPIPRIPLQTWVKIYRAACDNKNPEHLKWILEGARELYDHYIVEADVLLPSEALSGLKELAIFFSLIALTYQGDSKEELKTLLFLLSGRGDASAQARINKYLSSNP